jgi:ATP-dependent DNA helicase RecG
LERLRDLLGKIEQPLLFSSRDDYRHLSLVRDLEGTILTLLGRLADHTSASSIDAGMSAAVRQITGNLHERFTNFDALSTAGKKEVIQKSIDLLNELKLLTSPEQAREDALDRPKGGLQEDMEKSFAKLALSVQFIKGVGPKIAELFARKNIRTVEDLLYFLPRRYEDRRSVKKIGQARYGIRETVAGTVARADLRYYRTRRVFEVTVEDETGAMNAKWFMGNPAYLKNVFKKGSLVILTGDVRSFNLRREMIHPDYEILDEQEDDRLLHFKRIVPIYSETEGLHQKTIRRITMRVLEDYTRYVSSPIPEAIREKRRLIHIHDALRSAHFPEADADVQACNEIRSEAHRRLIYDEFFFLQLGMALKRRGLLLDSGIAFRPGGPLLKRFYDLLPFDLTGAQKRVIGEIEADMARSTMMNRLLQGDVGSGKTVVSMAAMITACENGCQAAIMAPTEILAEQHYRNIGNWSGQLGLTVALLTGSRKKAERKSICEGIACGDTGIIIGTHALIQEEVNFRNLGLVIVDEQHRFGVLQRAMLRAKGMHPDVLVMTATPIPRTLAMTVYGDLDISVIDELPPQKLPVKTKIFYESQRSQVYEAIRKELKKNHQAFIVYPLVEESEALDLKDASRMAEHLQKDIFPDHSVGLIHGRLQAKEKDEIMSAFLEKRIDVLVSTTVIEVGIDIPQASLMVIEHAERFGLSQLHQLRGRVGRSDIPSYCILLAQHRGSEDARKRLRIMEQTTDGFKIAEEDLAIRGPGEFIGVRQSGLPDFRVANIVRDGLILNEAKADAFALTEKDPFLERPEHGALKAVLLHKWQGRLELAKTG